MKYLDLTFADPRRDLACDEALGDNFEAADGGEVLRLWEPAGTFVVVGYSNRVTAEVNVAACGERGIAILRRFSGGGAVLQGPGCLNFTLVLRNERAGSFGDIGESYHRVLDRHRQVCARLTSEQVQIQGTSDLAIAGWKFSGNSQHRKQRYTVFHGTFLLNFDLSLIEACLPLPSRQPAYRQDRSHESFLRNLRIDPARVKQALVETWHAGDPYDRVPNERIETLVETRYGRAEWHNKF
ncbi:MAG: lipoate--protein ligase family protein [Deltaproteobacteria bacterium]|nr:lipoate--protein ligase family protein [Deltaproteobacteria bacterium]